jgi:ABC-type glycerol-3-phosphate transport system substrate-binding protein
MSYQRFVRTAAVLAVLALLLLALGACAPAAGPTAAPADSAAAPADTAAEDAAADSAAATGKPSGKLTIWVQQANQDVFEQTVLDAFQAEYPDIELEWVNYPPAEVASQMILAIQGGSGGPDLGVTETAAMARLVDLGGLLDLSDLVASYQEQFNAPALQESSKDGKIYGVPWDIGPVVTFYRRDIFKAAGLSDDPADVSEMLATWDSYLETCKVILDKTGLKCFALNKANNYGDMLFNMLWQQDLDLYSDDGKVLVDGPEYVATLEKIGEFWANDVVADELEWTDNWYAILKAPIDDPNVKPVATVPIAAWMGNFLKTWIAPDQAGNWGVALMPAFSEGGTRAANQGGSTAFIPANSANPEAAWAFIEFMLLRPENHIKIFEYSDYFPAFSAVYGDELFQQSDEYFGGQVTRSLFAEVAEQIPVGNQYGPFAGAIRGGLATALQKFAMGELSAEAALQEAANNIRTETGLQ